MEDKPHEKDIENDIYNLNAWRHNYSSWMDTYTDGTGSNPHIPCPLHATCTLVTAPQGHSSKMHAWDKSRCVHSRWLSATLPFSVHVIHDYTQHQLAAIETLVHRATPWRRTTNPSGFPSANLGVSAVIQPSQVHMNMVGAEQCRPRTMLPPPRSTTHVLPQRLWALSARVVQPQLVVPVATPPEPGGAVCSVHQLVQSHRTRAIATVTLPHNGGATHAEGMSCADALAHPVQMRCSAQDILYRCAGSTQLCPCTVRHESHQSGPLCLQPHHANAPETPSSPPTASSPASTLTATEQTIRQRRRRRKQHSPGRVMRACLSPIPPLTKFQQPTMHASPAAALLALAPLRLEPRLT